MDAQAAAAPRPAGKPLNREVPDVSLYLVHGHCLDELCQVTSIMINFVHCNIVVQCIHSVYRFSDMY